MTTRTPATPKALESAPLAAATRQAAALTVDKEGTGW